MNVTEILETLGIPYRKHGEHHHVTSQFVGVDCPWCSPSSGKYKLGISEYLTCTCWTCGRQNIRSVLTTASGRSYHEIAELLNKVERRERKEVALRGKLVIPSGVGELLRQHRNYLKKRTIDPEYATKVWGIKGIGIAPRLPWRLWLPIILHNKTLSWTTRSLSEQAKRKYVSASPDEESYPHKKLLYGEDLCRFSIVIVEGPFDALRIGPGAVCTFGTSVTHAQILRISRYPIRVVCFDNESAAQRAAEKICGALAVFPGKTTRIVLDAKDPGCASAKEIRLIRETFLD